MARTYRNVPFKHYWGETKEEAKKHWEQEKDNPGWFYRNYPQHLIWLKRNYLLHGTDARNYSYPTHEYFNRANRVGRRIKRDQLRPHIVLGENYDFDDSRYRRKYKGVWWDIY